MFTYKHLIWLGICLVIILTLTIISKKFKFSLKTSSLIMSIICILSEVSKVMGDMVENVNGGMNLNPRSLPFHLCSLMIFVVFYIFFTKESKLKQVLINFLACVGVVGSLMALLIPSVGVEFNEYMPYQSFIYHASLMWFAIYLIMFKHTKLNFKTYISNVIILLVLTFIMVYVNGMLQVYGTNFFFIVRPPVNGLPILNLNHGWHIYFISLIFVGLVLVSIFHLPFIIIDKMNSKKERINQE